jgi:putative hemolysin
MTPALVVLLLLIVAGLVVYSALFSGLETALFALRAHQLRRLESNHPGLAGFVQKFRENPRRVLAIILLGSALVNVFLIVICLALLWETPRATRLPPWLIALSLFAIIVFFCDLIPKLVALSAPYRLSTLGVFTLRALMPLLQSVGSALERISAAIVGLVTPRHIRARSHLSDEELETLIQIGAEQGTLQAAEGEMIQEVFPCMPIRPTTSSALSR